MSLRSCGLRLLLRGDNPVLMMMELVVEVV
jgi:hypothetical protein